MPKSAPLPLSEPVLRDHLAQHLDLIEPNLVLVDTEYRLKNEVGAGGSIDILARGSSGDLVIIELKRLDQSARQALHELEKYVGLLASDRGVRADRLRCVLLSTTWHELLVPFTRFVSHADFHVTGRQLMLGDDGYPIGSEIVALPQLDLGLETCPVHLNLLFASREARDAVRATVAGVLLELCVEDYITVDLDYAGTNPHVIYPFGHYVAVAEFAPALRDFVREHLLVEKDEDDEFDEGSWWHEQMVQRTVVAAARANDVEVSRPDRFGAIDDWEKGPVTGHGRYGDLLVWPTDELLRALSADGESFSMPFKRQVAVANKPAWSRMRLDLNRCLLGAGSWPGVVDALLDEIEQRPAAEFTVYAYVPTDVLAGLEHLARTGSSDYLPILMMGWRDATGGAMIGGKLEWDGVTHATSVDQTLGAVFEDFIQYITARVTGGLWEFEVDLCQLHGLFYDVGETTSEDQDDSLTRVALDADGALRRSPIHPSEPTAQDFVRVHSDYLNELVAVFESNTYRL